jgi:hypothetical protein
MKQGWQHKIKKPHSYKLRVVQPVVKRAKLNMHEFVGDDVDCFIQTIENYFDCYITPLEHRTKVDVTWL